MKNIKLTYKNLVKLFVVGLLVIMPVTTIAADNSEDCVGTPGPYGTVIDGDCPDTFISDNEVVNFSIMAFAAGVGLLAGSTFVKPETLEKLFNN
jgi:hypothetical protein